MEQCRNCGRTIKPVHKLDTPYSWVHDDETGYHFYCYPSDHGDTSKYDMMAEPLTKNEIIYAIIKEI